MAKESLDNRRSPETLFALTRQRRVLRRQRVLKTLASTCLASVLGAGLAVGTSTSAVAAPEADRLYPGEGLWPGQRIVSRNGRYVFVMQVDGNAAIVKSGNVPIWSTGTDGNPETVLQVQFDGNIVAYGRGHTKIWSTNTAGSPNVVLVIQDDSNLVAYAEGNRAIWASGIHDTPPAAQPSSPPRLLKREATSLEKPAIERAAHPVTLRPECGAGETVWVGYYVVVGGSLTASALSINPDEGIGRTSASFSVRRNETGVIFAIPDDAGDIITKLRLNFSGYGFILGSGCGGGIQMA